MIKIFLSAIVFGLGASLRPELLALMFIILANKRLARVGGFFLLAGILIGLLLLSSVTAMIGVSLAVITPGSELPVLETVELVLGAALLVSGLIVLVRRVKIRLPVLPENFRPAYLALVGCMLTLANSHVIIFTLAAMDRITVSHSGLAIKAAALLVYLLVSLLPAWVPLVGYILAPARAIAWLAALNGWIDIHFYQIAGAIVLVFGGYLMWHGL
jgi:Sap, sulfolipid-1-addressing protein